MRIGYWKYSGLLSPTRTKGEVGFRKNGGCIDIWLREADGQLRWYGVSAKALREFLSGAIGEIVLEADSDGQLGYPAAKTVKLR